MTRDIKALLIGGSGFIGSSLCTALLQHGCTPVIYDRVKPERDDVTFVPGDISTIAEQLPSLIQGVDVIYHLAWSTKPASANINPADDLSSNVLPGLKFLEVLAQQHKVPRLVFISSGGVVYGDVDTLPVQEDHPTNPIGAYGTSKLAYEHYLHVFHKLHNLDYMIFRPGNPFGPGHHTDTRQGVIDVFLRKMMTGDKIEVWGDGSVVRDYIFIDDLVSGLIKAIAYRPGSESSRIFNLGSGIGISVRELVAKLEDVSGMKADVEYLPERDFDVKQIALDCRAARSQLGWENTTDLESGIRQTYEWLLNK